MTGPSSVFCPAKGELMFLFCLLLINSQGEREKSFREGWREKIIADTSSFKIWALKE